MRTLKDLDVKILKIIKKVRLRLFCTIILDTLINGIILGTAAALILTLIARFIPIYDEYGKALIVAGIGSLIGLIAALFKFPNVNFTAYRIDSLGLKERVITAVHLMGNISPFALIQKEDALKHLNSLDYKKRIPIKPNLKNIGIAALIITLIILNASIPNAMKDVAIEKHRINEVKRAEVKKVESVQKDLAKNKELKDIQKAELDKKLQELKKEIQASKNDKEIDKAMQKAEKKLDLVKDNMSKENLNKIADTLAKSDLTKNLADTLKSGNEKDLKEQLKKAAENMKKASEAEKKELAEKLEALAKEVKNNDELKKSLEALGKKINQGELGDMQQELNNLDDSMEALMQNQNMNKAINSLQQAFKGNPSNSAASAAAQNDDEDPGTISSPSKSQGGQSAQGGQGAGQGSGSGSGSGAGSGNGSGGGGSGAGNGTGMSDGRPTAMGGKNNNGKKNGTSEKKEGEYEKIFTPKNLGGQSEKSNITGKKNDSGSTQKMNTSKSMTERGELLPYNQVVGEYKDKAFENMNNTDIPEGMRDVVKNYFSSLED